MPHGKRKDQPPLNVLVLKDPVLDAVAAASSEEVDVEKNELVPEVSEVETVARIVNFEPVEIEIISETPALQIISVESSSVLPPRYNSSTQTTKCNETPININVENLSSTEIIYFTGFELVSFNMVYSAINMTSNVYDLYLDCKNQLALTMMKYRRDIDFILIAKLYNLRRQIVSEIFAYWTKAIYNSLKEIDYWKLRHKSSEAYTAIIDCTEISTGRSSKDPNINEELFSNCKNHNTFKYLVAVDEKDLLIFCSKVYGGSKSDRFIIEDCGFLNLLKSGDTILADRSSNISDLLEAKNVALNIPPFRTAPQFGPKEILETRIITNRRIHVEKFINLSKKNKILSSIIPASLWPSVNEIVYNANMLCNFKKRVV